ncbi:MAG: PD-(D/E)XK nuclease family protein, partial [Thermoleophilia bacterium]
VRAAEGSLGYFGPVSERPHFAQALAATFTDLRQGLVAPGAAWARAAAGDAAAESAKAGDLQALYAAYCEELDRRGVLDDAEVYLAAARGARGGREAGKTILYGIYDLNRAQEVLVAELLAAGADVLVPVPREGAGDGAVTLDVARAAGLGESWLAVPAGDGDLARLAAVWRTVRPLEGPALSLAGDASLYVVSVADERGEVREAVRALLAAAGDGAAFWDCAVVVPHGDDVERVAAGLEAAGLRPACGRPDRSLGPRVLLRLAGCLAPPAGEPFSRRAVIDLLAAAPLRGAGASPREVALWLDEARQAGVVGGLDQWAQRVSRRRRGLERRLQELEVRGPGGGEDDDELDERLDLTRLRLTAVRGLEAAAGALGRACGSLPGRASWGVWAEVLAVVAEELFEAAAAAAVRDAAGGLKALGVLGEDVDATEMAAALREQLAGARVPVGRVGRDGVAVLTPLEIRGLDFHTVVFIGFAEGGFPARGRPDPILGDAERRRLGEAFDVRLPLAEQRDAEAELLFAFACEAARERLTLLAPRTDAASGRPRLPSRLLLRLASLAAGRPVGLDELLTGAPLAAVWRHVGGSPAFGDDAASVWVDARERDTAALLALGEGGLGGGGGDGGDGRGGGDGEVAGAGGPAAAEYLAAVLQDREAARRRLGQWSAARGVVPGAWDGLLGGEARAALAARHPFAAEMHPTRLERYVSCPFAFLLRDVLGLEAPEEPGDSLEMEPREFGTLAHGILQRAYETVIAAASSGGEGRPWRDAALAAVLSAWELGCAEAERRGVTGAALAWEVRRAMLLEDLLETVRRDPVFAPGDGRPIGVEWRFGEAAGRPVALELPGGRRVRFA